MRTIPLGPNSKFQIFKLNFETILNIEAMCQDNPSWTPHSPRTTPHGLHAHLGHTTPPHSHGTTPMLLSTI